MTAQPGRHPAVPWSQEPTGWGAADFSRAKVMLRLSSEAVEDIAECVRKVNASAKGLHQIARQDFSTPAIDCEMGVALNRLKACGGVVLMKGLCANDFSTSDLQKIHAGLGMHLGFPFSQSSTADIARDRCLQARGDSRGDSCDRRLELHCDLADIVGLLCVRRAIVGGETVLSSALRVYSIIRQRRPDLLEILKRGFRYPLGAGDVPVFCEEQGLVSCRYEREAIEAARRASGMPMTRQEVEALDLFDQIANSPELRVQFQLEPGEMLWLNNYEILRAREAFLNDPDPARARLLFRLWIRGAPARPVGRPLLVHDQVGKAHGSGGSDLVCREAFELTH